MGNLKFYNWNGEANITKEIESALTHELHHAYDYTKKENKKSITNILNPVRGHIKQVYLSWLKDFPVLNYFLEVFYLNLPPERNARIQDTYLNTYDSYIPITKGMLQEMQNEGFYEPYDGEEIDSETIDSDWTDDWIDDIKVV